MITQRTCRCIRTGYEPVQHNGYNWMTWMLTSSSEYPILITRGTNHCSPCHYIPSTFVQHISYDLFTRESAPKDWIQTNDPPSPQAVTNSPVAGEETNASYASYVTHVILIEVRVTFLTECTYVHVMP